VLFFPLDLVVLLIVPDVKQSTSHQTFSPEPLEIRNATLGMANCSGSASEHKYPSAERETSLAPRVSPSR
jgi:hypothetical protein